MSPVRKILVIFILYIMVILAAIAEAEDYYNLLGISKDADNKEIRRSFKKLALLYHPDKNKDNEAVQEKFVKISRAYEVLKDSETRRKYDQFGEAGLDDSHGGNYQYQSWSYFENFGIYDEDPEIITLSESDYSQSVQGRADDWFINFYSPMCSHCHHLAPVWREIAQEFLGVVRIGAVNCGEERSLCRQLGIHSYPTLKLYPNGEAFRGDRTKENLINYVLKTISPHYIKLTKNNLDRYLTDHHTAKLSWLIFVCNEASHCPSENTRLKLTVMLKGMVNVAMTDRDSSFSKTISKEGGVIFYDVGKVNKDLGRKIDSNDAQDIFHTVIQFLPEIKDTVADSLDEFSKKLNEEQGTAHLLCFYNNGELDANFKQLLFQLKNIEISRIDCDESFSLCNQLHIHKFPAFVLLKREKKYEVYHGRVFTKDIVGFVEDSLASTVESLGPDDFPDRVIYGGEPWFVDFYAPWCPPCLRLLPEWRRASQEIGDIVHFGTVDCTIHHSLCTEYKINSYPTTVLYNQTVPHKYDGHRNFLDIVEFVKDTLTPTVIALTSSTFEKSIHNRNNDEIWIVDFFAPWCGPCQQLSVQWKKLAKMLIGNPNIHVAQVDCTVQLDLCDTQGIQAYPTIKLFPSNSPSFITYDSYNRDAHSLRAWVYKFVPSRVLELDNNDFYNKVIYDTQMWIVDFYAPWCQHCEHFAPEFERVAQSFGDKVKAAKINCDVLQYVCSEAGVKAYPTVKFYIGSSQRGLPQNMQGVDVPGLKMESIIPFVNDFIESIKKSGEYDGHDEL